MNIMNNSLFLTTTLPYVNSSPHIGHTLEFVLGDVIARYHRTKTGVYFNIGLDEHGSKVWSTARDKNVTPLAHCDEQDRIWKDFCKLFNISFDNFYRTTSPSHREGVESIWGILNRKGLIYKKEYTGTYCKGCESFKTSREIVEGVCPDHPNTPLETVSESNWFFRMTSLRESVANHIKENKDFLTPFSKTRELLNLLESYEDISISRPVSSCPWGIPVPGDGSQVIHVWFDALCNYIIASEDSDRDNVIQLCGPDNIRFQGGFYQAILLALELPYTKHIVVHGTVLDQNGHKMSKSTGNTVCPFEQAGKWGVDAVRYHLVTGLETTSDSAWDEKRLVENYNSDLCDDWGNLVARTLHLCDLKGCEERPTEDFRTIVDGELRTVDVLFSEFRIKDAYSTLNSLVKYANKYINDHKPWSMEDPRAVLGNLLYLITKVNRVYSYVLPEVFGLIDDAIVERKKIIAFKKIIHPVANT